MLKNAYLVVKIGVDTAENEPSKVSMKWGFQTGIAPVMFRTASDIQTNCDLCGGRPGVGPATSRSAQC
ncbi:MAG: hypothetical protein CL712_03670, partial [Chloroflexi bacterium]|nr:hypothetical protein [Chloroflexota bacterium]